MSYKCEYCESIFTKAYSMYKHQRTAKYCLEIQNKQRKNIHCSQCDREFSRKDALLRHQNSCVKHEITQNNHFQEQIEELKQIISELSGRPAPNVNNVNNRNNVVMNLPPVTDEELQEHLDHLTIDLINEGAKGYANYYPFKDRVVCTDKARKKLRYKGSDGEIVDDTGGTKLAQRFFQTIAQRNEELINTEYGALQQQVQQIAEEGRGFTSDLTGILTKASRLQELLMSCQAAARGEENELTREFISHLSKML